MTLRPAVRVALLPIVMIPATAACLFGGKATPPAQPVPPQVVLPPPAPAPEPYRARITLAASADVNPDATGRPSPIVVRIYQLKSDAAFGGADYFPLFDDEQKVLGSDLITRREYVMAPAEQRVIELDIDLDARFVGVLAAFRDIRNAEWRALVPAARKDLTVAIGRARAGLTVAK
jgi:type VI secretion system protein VasD